MMIIVFLISLFLISYYLYLKKIKRRVAFSIYFLYLGLFLGIFGLLELFLPFSIYYLIPLKIRITLWLFLALVMGGYLLFLCLNFHYQKTIIQKEADVLLVFGAGLFGDRLSLSLKTRLDTCYELAIKYPQSKIIVTGGQGKDELVTEASAMKKYLVELGIKQERIIEEDKSTSTYENIVYASRLYPFDKQMIAFISNQFHLYRISKIMKKLGYQGYGVAASLHSPAGLVFYTREYLAFIKGLLKKEI